MRPLCPAGKAKVSALRFVAVVLCLLGLDILKLAAQGSDVYQAAQRAFREKDFAVAAKLFRQTETEFPGMTDAELLLAKSLVKMNQFQASEEALGKYLERHPESADAAYLCGYVLFREGRAAPSLDAYTHAATRATPKAGDLKIVALDYVMLHDDASAARWLERSVEMDASDAEAWYFLGRAYFSQSRFADAERAFSQALRLNPTFIRARNNLGLTYEAENRSSDALREYTQAVAEDRAARTRTIGNAVPTAPSPAKADSSVRTDEATKIVGIEDSTADIKDSTTMTSLPAEPASSDETGAQPYLNLGSLLTLQNRPAEAILVLREAVALSASCVACHTQLGRALARTGALPAARTELELAVKLSPSDPALHYELGRFYQRSGEAAAARIELARSKELYGNRSTQPAAP